MWIIRNLRCHYLQNTITNSEKIFDTNSINHFTNIAKVLRGGVSELIGNYEYLRILPQPSEVKTFGMVMIRNCFTNVIKVFKGGVSYQTGNYESLPSQSFYLHQAVAICANIRICPKQLKE